MTDKTKFEFFGNAAYRITNREGKVILIDPFLNDSDCSPIKVKDLDRVDLLLVTHAAWDHMGDTLEIAKKFECPVVCGGEVRHHLVHHGGLDPENIRAMCWGLQVVEKVGSPRVKLLYDIYHMQIMEGDIIRTLETHIDAIGHIHTAGNPGRNELDDHQELNYGGICRALAATTYAGYIGHEFHPRGGAIAALRQAFEICSTGRSARLTPE